MLRCLSFKLYLLLSGMRRIFYDYTFSAALKSLVPVYNHILPDQKKKEKRATFRKREAIVCFWHFATVLHHLFVCHSLSCLKISESACEISSLSFLFFIRMYAVRCPKSLVFFLIVSCNIIHLTPRSEVLKKNKCREMILLCGDCNTNVFF